MKYYIGIDPGKSGGLALISGDGVAIEYDRMPEGPKGILDFFHTARIASNGQLVVVLESGGTLQGKLAFKSAGLYLGYIRMICTIMEIPMSEVLPGKWKKNMSLNSDKTNSIRLAEQLFPTINLIFPRCSNKHDGCAEALLIAEWGRRQKL